MAGSMSLSKNSPLAMRQTVWLQAVSKQIRVQPARFAEQSEWLADDGTIVTSTLLADVTNRLTLLTDTPALDASVLLAHITTKPRTWVMAHSELTLTAEQQKQLNDSLTRLERGE